MAEEFVYMESHQVGKLFDLVLQLAADLHVTQNRVRSLEMILARANTIEKGQVDAFVPDAEEQATLDENRDALMARVMRIITESGPASAPLRDEWPSFAK